jgi:hypothetical protein
MKQLQRISVFRRAENEKGHIQAVISSADAEYFYQLGFGPSVNDMPELDIEPLEQDEFEPEPSNRGRGRGRSGRGDSQE